MHLFARSTFGPGFARGLGRQAKGRLWFLLNYVIVLVQDDYAGLVVSCFCRVDEAEAHDYYRVTDLDQAGGGTENLDLL
jgi:hypothetical protein